MQNAKENRENPSFMAVNTHLARAYEACGHTRVERNRYRCTGSCGRKKTVTTRASRKVSNIKQARKRECRDTRAGNCTGKSLKLYAVTSVSGLESKDMGEPAIARGKKSCGGNK